MIYFNKVTLISNKCEQIYFDPFVFVILLFHVILINLKMLIMQHRQQIRFSLMSFNY